MTIQMNDFIQTYDDALEPETCKFLIDVFENCPNHQEVIDNDKKPSFTQFNLTENRNISDEVEKVHQHIISKLIEYRNRYYEYVDSRVFPEKHNYEQFRIKRYNNDGNDLFDTHVDVMDHASARRFLSYLFYLNDVSEGGETVFQGLTTLPKCGRLLMFPPLWTFPHRGNAPRSNPKYILTAYLHYR